MKNKTLFLIAGIITSFAFIGTIGETEPHIIFGYSVNIWLVRLFWAFISYSNFTNYFKMKKVEKESI